MTIIEREERYALWLDNDRAFGSAPLPMVNAPWKAAKTFGEAKHIILRSGMPIHISLNYHLDGIETCIPFMIWLMHDYWDVNIGPHIPTFALYSKVKEEKEEFKNLVDNWQAYAH